MISIMYINLSTKFTNIVFYVTIIIQILPHVMKFLRR